MIEENEYAQRTFTIGSTFFDDFTIKTNNINEGTGTFSEHGQFKGPSNRVGSQAFTSMKATTHLSYVGYRTEDKIETPTDRITPAADIHKDTALILNINT
jgi:hypothetical protein